MSATSPLATLRRRARELFSARDWRGDCYEVAYRLLGDAGVRDARLVHGWPLGLGGEAKGRRYGHAWVECGEAVFDVTVRAEPFDRSVFYRLGSIERATVYTLRKARAGLLRSGTWGPWEVSECDPYTTNSGGATAPGSTSEPNPSSPAAPGGSPP